MRDQKRYAALAILTLAAVCMLNGCKGKPAETETQSETVAVAQTEAQTEAVKNTYTSANGTFSIDLPDTTWSATKEGEKNEWVFTSAEAGTITIKHKKSAISAGKLPEDQSEAEELLNKIKSGSFSGLEYKKESISSADLYYYAAKTADSEELGYMYLIRYLISGEKEGYSLTAELKVDDAATVQAVKTAVTSFQMLKEDTGSDSSSDNSTDASAGDASKEDASTDDESTDSSSGNSEGVTSDTGEEERYFFDASGNTVYAYPSTDGSWTDNNGLEFYFYEDGVEDSNGAKYYYDPPTGTSNNTSTDNSASAESGNSSASSSDGSTADFYDSNGNYVTATQDANGNWVGDDGKTYTFSDKGVTDSDGNFSAW